MNTAAAVDRGDDFSPTEVDDPVVTDAATPVADEPAVVEDAQPEPEVKEPKEDKKGWIPKARFDEAVRKEREKLDAERARVKELEEKQQATTLSEDITKAQAWIKEMIRKRNSYLSDGELDKASELDDKIFEVQDAIADRRAEMRAANAKESAKSEVQYDSMVARMEEMYPQISPDSDEYDEEAVAEVRALMSGYQKEMRLSAAKALERAAKRVFGDVRKADTDAVAEAGLRRKAEAVKRNLETAEKQPPRMETGMDHDKRGGGLDAKTVMKMDYKEFNKLSEDVLAKLRGDDI